MLRMNKIFVLTIAFLGTACGATHAVNERPLVALDRRPEIAELPTDPEIEAIPEGYDTTLGEELAEPLEAGQCVDGTGVVRSEGPCPGWSGIAISEARAARNAMYRIRYRELRRGYQADRQVWAAHRELYEAQVLRDREEIENLQPTWWDRNGFIIGIAGGFILGAATAILVMFVVEQVDE
jgi:hypothetical protein